MILWREYLKDKWGKIREGDSILTWAGIGIGTAVAFPVFGERFNLFNLLIGGFWGVALKILVDMFSVQIDSFREEYVS